MENGPTRPEIPQEKFDAKGNPRKLRELPDGTVSLLSDEEFQDEMEQKA